MTAPPAHLDLAADFPAASRAQWQELVAAVLTKSGRPVPSDAPPETALAGRNYDGIEIAPLYTAADAPAGSASVPGSPPFTRGATAEGAARTGWDVRARHLDPDPLAANRAVLDDLRNGVSSLWLVLGGSGNHSAGLTAADLPRVLDGVHLDLAPIVLDAGPDARAAAETLLRLAADHGTPATDLTGSLGGDPIGYAARIGSTPDLTLVVDLAGLAAGHPKLRPVTVDATVYSDAGGSDGDELAISVAVGVAYLRALTDAAVPLDAALGMIEFRYAVSADQFASIAKLRAARRVWNRVGELSGAAGEDRGQQQHAVTAASMLTRRDPWVNLLRTTIGCFAAAVGGAQAITVAPFDSALGLPDDFGRRIARNTSAVLHDEASLARVIDPAGGSWYVESLTERLAEAAWQKFTALERAGGAVAALESGAIASLLASTRQRRQDDIAHRRTPITGVSEYAVNSETLLSRRPAPAAPSGGLPRLRAAEPFEALRDASDAWLASTGARPRLFLAALGPVAAHTGRLSFTRNLLGAGGLEPVVATGELADLLAGFAASGAVVACLCSSDRIYAGEASAAATALKAAGARTVWIAGSPDLLVRDGSGEQLGAIDAALYSGCDAVAVLRSMLSDVGVPV